MSGRRRTGALAGALDLTSQLLLHRQEEGRRRREKAEEYALKFKTELALEQAKKGLAYTDPFTGQPVEATPSAFDLSDISGASSALGSTYGPPSLELDPRSGAMSSIKLNPLSPTEQGKAEELSLIRSATPFPSALGQENMVRSPTGAYQEFAPQEISAGVPQQFAERRLTALRAPDLNKQKRQNLVDSTKIREEFLNRPEVKEYVTINTQVRSMDTLLKKATEGNLQNKAALDQALITMFNKLTDPTSVVRESEYARTPQNLPLANRFSGALQKLAKGGAGLTDQDRLALVWGAKVIANERGRTFNETLSGYEDLSSEYGIESNLITRGLSPHQDYGLTTPGVTSYLEGQTATNPQTGERLIFRAGKWQPTN